MSVSFSLTYSVTQHDETVVHLWSDHMVRAAMTEALAYVKWPVMLELIKATVIKDADTKLRTQACDI